MHLSNSRGVGANIGIFIVVMIVAKTGNNCQSGSALLTNPVGPSYFFNSISDPLEELFNQSSSII